MKKLLQKVVLASLIVALPLNANVGHILGKTWPFIAALSALAFTGLSGRGEQRDIYFDKSGAMFEKRPGEEAKKVESPETAAPSVNTEPAQTAVRADIEDFQPIVTESETTVAEPTFSPVLTAIVVMVALKIGIDLWNWYWTPEKSVSNKTPKKSQTQRPSQAQRPVDSPERVEATSSSDTSKQKISLEEFKESVLKKYPSAC